MWLEFILIIPCRREIKYGMPSLQLQENQDLDVRIRGLTLQLEPDDPEVMTNGFSRINRVLEKDIVEYEDGQNDITYNNAKVKELTLELLTFDLYSNSYR